MIPKARKSARSSSQVNFADRAGTLNQKIQFDFSLHTSEESDDGRAKPRFIPLSVVAPSLTLVSEYMNPVDKDYIMMISNIPSAGSGELAESVPERKRRENDLKNQKDRETKAKQTKPLTSVRSLPAMDKAM